MALRIAALLKSLGQSKGNGYSDDSFKVNFSKKRQGGFAIHPFWVRIDDHEIKLDSLIKCCLRFCQVNTSSNQLAPQSLGFNCETLLFPESHLNYP